jgi:signal transduction histidine kinase
MIFLTLSLALGLFSFVLQQTQQSERDRVEQRLKQTAEQVSQNLETPRTVLDLPNYLLVIRIIASTSNVRFFLVQEDGQVLVDTDTAPATTMTKNKFPNYILVPRDDTVYRGEIILTNTKYIYFALPGPTVRDDPENTNGRVVYLKTDLLLAVPEAQLAFDWGDFLRWVAIAGLIALLASILAAYFMARNISRPLIRMTRASEAIAQGNYEQKLDTVGKGEDEISRLAISFNRMSEEVARSNQSMRDFVANVSHELKTPLTSIQGFSQAVLDGTIDTRPMLEHSLQVINEEASRMRRLVDELLDLSRIESGQISYNWREIDVRYLMERVLMKLNPLAIQKGIQIIPMLSSYELQIPGRDNSKTLRFSRYQLTENNQKEELNTIGPLIWGDSDRLEQVFTNITDNAIKYSAEGGEVKVELRLAQSDNNGNPANSTGNGLLSWVLVRISNTGPLIPHDELPRIFERFYKVDKSRSKKKGESTGLGLAIVRELIEAHRGQIQVQSVTPNPTFNYPYPVAINEGLTTFSIYLPLLALPVAMPPRDAPAPVFQS